MPAACLAAKTWHGIVFEVWWISDWPFQLLSRRDQLIQVGSVEIKNIADLVCHLSRCELAMYDYRPKIPILRKCFRNNLKIKWNMPRSSYNQILGAWISMIMTAEVVVMTTLVYILIKADLEIKKEENSKNVTYLTHNPNRTNQTRHQIKICSSNQFTNHQLQKERTPSSNSKIWLPTSNTIQTWH